MIPTGQTFPTKLSSYWMHCGSPQKKTDKLHYEWWTICSIAHLSKNNLDL